MPSALAPGRFEALLGHCWKLAKSADRQVVIEVAPLGASPRP
jgi:hypothetical protein